MVEQADPKIPQIRFGGFDKKWEDKPIGKILSEINRSIVLLDDTQYELITVKRRNEGVVSRGHLLGRNILVKNYSQLEAGDFIISKRQVVHGATGMVPESLDKAIVSNEYLVAASNDDISTAFLTLLSSLPDMRKKFFLSSYGVDIEKLFFDVNDWKKRIVTIPEVPEQNKIDVYFKELNHLIGLHQKKHDKLVQLKKSMLQKMFPQDGATTPEIRFKGFSGDWGVKKLGDLCEPLTYGLNAAAKKFDGKNKYLRITDIEDESRSFIETSLTSPDIDLTKSQNYLLQEGDIVFARTGASVGKTYLYKEEDGHVFYAGFLIRARTKPNQNADFIFQNTLSKEYECFVRLTSQRSGQPGINATEYSDFSFYCPKSYAEQEKIGNYLHNIDLLISKYTTQIEKLKQIKLACLEKMFVQGEPNS